MEKGAIVGQGRTADVFAWGKDRILKLYQPSMPPDAVKQDFLFSQAAKNAGLPVPFAEKMVEVDDRPGIIFEKVDGLSMLKIMMAQPWKIVSLAGQLGELHAMVHCHEAPEGLRTQRQYLCSAIQTSSDLSEPAIQAVLAYLEELPQGSRLCHGDFHPDNVLMTAHGPMIIDWMTGCRGNPLGDASRTVMILRTSGLPPGAPGVIRAGFRFIRQLVLSCYRKHYLKAHPAARQELETWQLPHLAARLREVEAYPLEKQLILNQIQSLLEKDI